MCGIVGIASQRVINDLALCDSMRETLSHRGPDAAGTWRSPDRRVVLNQRRLAVIDLSAAGRQPMSDPEEGLWTTFNGEIYNYRQLKGELEGLGHRFRSESDTEVILHAYRAWGEQCVKRFNGMFAFALYDVAKRKLFLARDRAGEKPLYYRHAGGTFRFASELKALMADPECPRILDIEALNYYLTFGYVPGSLCILKGMCKLPQGHAACYDLASDELSVWPYWTLPEPEPGLPVNQEQLVDELEALLRESVRMRLVADVPVGIMLSGGLDSSLVTAMAADISPRAVKTFNISFPGHGVFDESALARPVAKHFGCEHVELAAEPASVDLLPELAMQYDEPIADSSMVPTYIVSKLIRQEATVALGGDGGDELFGGYRHYGWIERQERIRQYLPLPMRRMIGLGAARIPVGVRGRNFLLSLTKDVPQSIAHVNLFFDAYSRQRLLTPLWYGSSRPESCPESYKVGLCRPSHTLLQNATSVDFQTYLVDDILVKVDRASMLSSLEVRAPWLDHRIIEFAFSRVPDSMRASGRDRKILLRRLGARLLPREFDLKRKQGFAMPLSAWFKGDWGTYMVDVLSEASDDLFDRGMIRSLIANQRRGLANVQRLFALTIFELWRRHYRISA